MNGNRRTCSSNISQVLHILCILSIADFFKKAIEKAQQTKVSNVKVRLDSLVIISSCMACNLYITAINTLSQLRLDILTGMGPYRRQLLSCGVECSQHFLLTINEDLIWHLPAPTYIRDRHTSLFGGPTSQYCILLYIVTHLLHRTVAIPYTVADPLNRIIVLLYIVPVLYQNIILKLSRILAPNLHCSKPT